MNIVVYLPGNFYASIASFLSEFFLAMNAVRGEAYFNLKFICQSTTAKTRSGISFPITKLGSKDKIDLLIFLAGHAISLANLEAELDDELGFAKKIIDRALKDNAVIAGTCSASFLMARAGLLEKKRATISWWAAAEAQRLFPNVLWDSTRIVSKHKNIYTSGGVYSAMDLLTSVLADMGFRDDLRKVRKILVSPPVRQLQSPYEMDFRVKPKSEFEIKLDSLIAASGLAALSAERIAKKFGMTPKTLNRRFKSELDTTPTKWIQARRIGKAKEFLEATELTINQICSRVGYDDPASFARLFSRVTGLTPRDFRRHMQI